MCAQPFGRPLLCFAATLGFRATPLRFHEEGTPAMNTTVSGIAQRAALAVRRTRAVGGHLDEVTPNDPEWLLRAHHARTVAAILGVDPVGVIVTRDPVRSASDPLRMRYPAYLITVYDQSGTDTTANETGQGGPGGPAVYPRYRRSRLPRPGHLRAVWPRSPDTCHRVSGRPGSCSGRQWRRHAGRVVGPVGRRPCRWLPAVPP